MGGVSTLCVCFLFLLICLMAEPDRETRPSNQQILPLPPPPAPFDPVFAPIRKPEGPEAPFRPSIAVIVGVLTTMFSITFLLLLYAKHCKGGNRNSNSTRRPHSSAVRKNSGIERSVIESLPIFRFSSLRGQKEGLDCAVCLNGFEPREVLRLLPKCKHAFHVECVDTWLDAHSTCPLCRYRVDPEDILLVEESKIRIIGSNNVDEEQVCDSVETRRISGRHSSAGERKSHFLVERPGESDFRRSLDTCLRKKTESVSVGCFDRGCRKDGLLLLPEAAAAASATTNKDIEAAEAEAAANRENFLRRFQHRIILSSNASGTQRRRWSDLRPSDLLFLRSRMMIAENNRRYSMSASRPPPLNKAKNKRDDDMCSSSNNIEEGNGKDAINSRTVSEITGFASFSNVNQ